MSKEEKAQIILHDLKDTQINDIVSFVAKKFHDNKHVLCSEVSAFINRRWSKVYPGFSFDESYGWTEDVDKSAGRFMDWNYKDHTITFDPPHFFIPIPKKVNTSSERASILDKAKQTICQDRVNQYGEPENSFAVIAEYWTTYIQSKYPEMVSDLTKEDVAQMMVLQKIARQITGEGKMDNFVDGAGYMAIAGELWDKEQEEKNVNV